MHYLRDRAFVLRRVNFGECDRYITLFSEQNGKVEVLARGVRKITSRRAAACELLNLVEFQSVKTSKNFILTEVKLIDSFEHLKRELLHIKKVFLICELIDAVLPLGVKHPDVYDLMSRAALRICENEKNMAYFQAKLLSILGFWDGRSSFKDEAHVTSYMERIIERKIKTTAAFAPSNPV